MNCTLVDFRADTLYNCSSVTIDHDCDAIKRKVFSPTFFDCLTLPILFFSRPNMAVSDISSCISGNSFILNNFLANRNIEEYQFAKYLISIIKEKSIIDGFDIGIRYMLKTLNKSLLNSEYGKCNTFLELVEKDIPQFDLRLHICVLTITSHWKTALSSRNNYFLSVEKFALDNFDATKVKKMLTGLE